MYHGVVCSSNKYGVDEASLQAVFVLKTTFANYVIIKVQRARSKTGREIIITITNQYIP